MKLVDFEKHIMQLEWKYCIAVTYRLDAGWIWFLVDGQAGLCMGRCMSDGAWGVMM